MEDSDVSKAALSCSGGADTPQCRLDVAEVLLHIFNNSYQFTGDYCALFSFDTIRVIFRIGVFLYFGPPKHSSPGCRSPPLSVHYPLTRKNDERRKNNGQAISNDNIQNRQWKPDLR